MFRYAQINDDGFVVSDSHLSGKVEKDNMIPIDDDFDIKNKKYANGEWVDYNPEPIEVTAPEPTQLDRIEETATNMALSVDYLTCLQEMSAESI